MLESMNEIKMITLYTLPSINYLKYYDMQLFQIITQEIRLRRIIYTLFTVVQTPSLRYGQQIKEQRMNGLYLFSFLKNE